MAQNIPNFTQTLKEHRLTLYCRTLETLQVNVGRLCNQTCKHCHIDAGPAQTDTMKKKTVDRILDLLQNAPYVKTVDITGGAPELNRHFRYFVSKVREMDRAVIDRCNLTVLFEPGQEDVAEFLQYHKVKIICSLPCYTEENVDKQRGNGVFKTSIKALLHLNNLGYGKPGTGLELDIVYNPGGAFLPSNQVKLEEDYKLRLKEDFNVEFNNLYTFTNMPINRFERKLKKEGQLEEYFLLLFKTFNPHSAVEVMCQDQVSINWDGNIYNCDFNLILDIPIYTNLRSIWDIKSLDELNQRPIAVANHCYGCTAGAGSSCTGVLVEV